MSSLVGCGSTAEFVPDGATTTVARPSSDQDQPARFSDTADTTDRADSTSSSTEVTAPPAEPIGPDDDTQASDDPEPAPATENDRLVVTAPTIHASRDCFESSADEMTFTPTGVVDLAVDNRLGRVSSSSAAPGPIVLTRDFTDWPLLAEGIVTEVDDAKGYVSILAVHGRLGDITIDWTDEHFAAPSDVGRFRSPLFRSTGNPACWAEIGYTVAVETATLPDEPTPSPAGEDDIVPQGDLRQVVVENIALVTAAGCYEGDLTERFLDTPTSAVAVVLDTHGHTPLASATRVHERTRFDADQPTVELVSDIHSQANVDDGYQVSILVSGFLSGGFVLNFTETFDQPGIKQSPIFTGVENSCTARVQFEITENPVVITTAP